MEKSKKNIILNVFILILFLIIIVKVFDMQIVKKKYYNHLLEIKNNKIFMGCSSPRGRILDKNGKILVDNVGIKMLVYRKSNNTKKIEIKIADSLAEIITIDEGNADDENIYSHAKYGKLNSLNSKEKKAAKIYKLMQKDYYYQDKIISKNVSDEEYARIIEANIPGVRGELDWERTYPYKEVLKNVFGRVSNGLPKDNYEYYINNGYELNDRVGISNIEKMYENELKGQKAVYKINNDNTISKISNEVKGNDIRLNIDIDLQMEIEEILKNEMIKAKSKLNTKYYDRSFIVVSDVNTGDILSLVGLKINTTKKDYYFTDISNEIFTSSYTMGSIVKGASMTVGYKNNAINSNKKILDSCIKLYNNPIKCSWKKLGYINDIDALKYSSNYYQFNIALNINKDKYHYNKKVLLDDNLFNIYRNVFSEYGLGNKTEIDVPYESIGIKGKKESMDLLLNYTIGQYDTYTPLQIVQYINTIATKGKRYALNLANRNVKLINEVKISNEKFERIHKGMMEVFKKGGTASGYIDEQIKVAGKTGTSESFLDTNSDGKIDTSTISTTLALFFPYDNPKYSITIISPHISYENSSNNSYKYLINKYLSNKITNKMFALYFSL